MTPNFYIKSGFLSFADKNIFDNLELYISSGDRICLIGKNGSGKSSLMKVISGMYELDGGELFIDPSVTIEFLRQDMSIESSKNIYDYVLEDFENEEDVKFQADIILSQLEIDGTLELSQCSGGQIRRANLAKSLIKKPEILLLDEPTNHLDITAIEWLESYLNSYNGAIVCISHDRKFLENITNKVWWIDRKKLRISNKGFKHYETWRDEIILQEESQIRKMNRKLEAENRWLHDGGITARRKRNQKRLASLNLLRETLRVQKDHLSKAKASLQIELEKEQSQSKFILQAKNISFGYKNKNILREFNFKIKKGEKIGVIGPNGCGKSTLINLITGNIQPDSGEIVRGNKIDISYFDQHRTDINLNDTVKRTLCPTGGDYIELPDKTLHVAAYLKKFLFDPKIAQDKVGTLSGGEANRLLLARTLINPGNFFILDEPTNDLDIDTLEMLLDVLADYKGTLIVISHDRDFLEKLVTRTLVFGQEGIVDLYGGYEDYLKFYSKKPIITSKSKSAKREINTIIDDKPKKLSYKYQRLLEVLPIEIDQLEKKIIDIEEKLADSDLYSKDSKKFTNYSQKLELFKSEIEEKTEQWFEIQAMNENLE